MSIAIPLDRITIRADARAIDSATVTALADSIAECGLINPVRVREAGDRYELIAGVHRFTACRSLGLAEIEAIVCTDDDLRAELAMIDENLCRAELSPADRAKQTARRKAIYLELHPETGHGKATPSKDDNLSSFADATATATGRDKRTVQRDAERGAKVIDAVLDMVRGTPLDTGKFLDSIKNLSAGDQLAATRRELAEIKRQERERERKRAGGIAGRYKTAAAPISDEDARENQVAALMAAWNKASAEARQEFLARIDTPVFDHSRAA